MLGRKTANLASPRSRETTCRTTAERTANPNRGQEAPEGDHTISDNIVGVVRPEEKLAAAYARVSTDRQEQQETIASQLDALQTAAEEKGYDLPAEFLFIDDGYSGSTLDRPALDRLRDLVNEGAIDMVLIYAPDRLARHYAYQVVVLEEFKRAGSEVLFLNHAFGQSPEEQMLLQIQGVFAEYERALIKERTRRGRLFAARQGRVNWGGNPPYGFRYMRKTDTAPQQLLVCEEEAVVVQQMYRWLVEEELSSYAIQKRLTDRQIPTRGNNTQGWCQSSVIKILRNPLYKGEAAYNRSQQADTTRPRGPKGLKDIRPGNNRSRIARPRDEWITVPVPALVDPDLWELAQGQLAYNRERATRNNTKHDYLLRGLLVCGRCGRRLIGVWSRVSGGRYMCSARLPRSAPWSCLGRSVAATRVEPLVWNYIRELLSNSDILRARYAEGRGDPLIDERDERERERLERKLQALDGEVQRLIDAYQASVIDLPELQTRRQRVEDHGTALRARLRDLTAQRESREQQLRVVQGLDEFCASMRNALQDPNNVVKQKVLQLVVDRIVVDEHQLTIRHVVPTGPVRLQTRPHVANTRESSCFCLPAYG
jgi:site-specific DNA recombinase